MSRITLLLSLMALLLPAAAHGEKLLPPGSPPARGFSGFRTLFHVPPAPVPPIAAAPMAAPIPPRAAQPPYAPGGTSPGNTCRTAVSAAEQAHGIPAGLLLAMGLVESGRTDPQTGQRSPWPWAVNVEGRGALFDTREAALDFVRQAEAGGARSIDTGCLQVNRLHHPAAFASLEQSFDPVANADYAARFLKQLKEGPAGGDWMKAAGFYHSQTPARADGYRARVQTAMSNLPPVARPPMPAATPGGGGQMLSNGAEQATLLASNTAGRGLDAYRARPVPLALVMTGLRRSALIQQP